MAILMCRPQYFGVEYEINAWMHVANRVDSKEAEAQWDALYRAYLDLGQTVELVDPQPGLPDMVFTANAALLKADLAVLSSFKHSERQGEEPFWQEALEKRGFKVSTMPEGVAFEGAGDALFVGDRLFAGYGFRTDRESHDVVSQVLGQDVVSLELVDPRFYHLDTCFCPLGPEVVMFAPEAFAKESAREVRKQVPHVIEVPSEVAADFVCNGVVVGKSVLSSVGVERLETRLRDEGFETRSLPMTEFMKSGGGVRCLSLFLS